MNLSSSIFVLFASFLMLIIWLFYLFVIDTYNYSFSPEALDNLVQAYSTWHRFKKTIFTKLCKIWINFISAYTRQCRNMELVLSSIAFHEKWMILDGLMQLRSGCGCSLAAGLHYRSIERRHQHHPCAARVLRHERYRYWQVCTSAWCSFRISLIWSEISW